jgi:hypothetical protein
MRKILSLLLAIVLTASSTGLGMSSRFFHKDNTNIHRVLEQKETEDMLFFMYIADSNEYFDGKLPIAPILYEDMAGDNDPLAETVSENGRLSKIVISSYYARDWSTIMVNLHHEECHAALLKANEFESHGPKWQACMDRLYEEGAFKGLL